MKLVKNNNYYEEIYERLESKGTDVTYYMGVYPVLFGYRVRAGIKGEPTVELDWCCGDDAPLLTVVYKLLQHYMEQHDGKTNPFKGLPNYSEYKPLKLDREFINKVNEHINGFDLINIMYKEEQEVVIKNNKENY